MPCGNRTVFVNEINSQFFSLGLSLELIVHQMLDSVGGNTLVAEIMLIVVGV